MVEEKEEVEVNEEVKRVRVEVYRKGGNIGKKIMDFDIKKKCEKKKRIDIKGKENDDVKGE